jgi:uncharacterized membrane protein
MSLMPDLLHPALVHFPVALVTLGSAVAVAAVFWRKGYVPAFAAVLLGLGALGAWAAIASGKSDGGLLEQVPPPMESLLEAHETWAERTHTAAAIASVAAVGSALLGRFPRAARGAAVVAALVAGAASYTVYETGHRGGALVFKHGAGVAVTASASAANGALKPTVSGPAKTRALNKRDDRDRD